MEDIYTKCIQTLTFLILIITPIHLLNTKIINKFTVNFDNVTVKKSPQLPLRFSSEEGTFKILQVADMHYGQGVLTRCRDVTSAEFKYCSDLNTTRFVQRLIAAEKPDFLVFTGDNIFGSSTPDAAESLFRVFRPAMQSGLPWAAILGNHDQESTMNREELMSLISLMDYSVSQVNPSVQHPYVLGDTSSWTKIDGFGNYNLTVLGPYGSASANLSVLNLFFLDSGDRVTVEGRRTYGWIRESQLDWLKGAFQGERDEHGGTCKLTGFVFPRKTPTALGFFHVPIPEIKLLYHQKVTGHFQEAVACSSVYSGVLNSLVSMENVKAVFIGHDHTNDFCGNLGGVWFCYGGGSGYHGYGKIGWPRRARVILAQLSKRGSNWMGLEKVSTWKRLDDEMLSKIDEQLLLYQDS